MAGQHKQLQDQDEVVQNGSKPDNETEAENINEEYDMLDSKLDELNSALDYLEQKNDDIHEKLKELLRSNIKIREELRNENNMDTSQTK